MPRGGSRLAVRPTARGWQALAAGLTVLLTARLIGTTQFHQLAYALLALLAASLVLGLLGSRGLRFSRALPRGGRVTAGIPARVDLSLERPRLGARLGRPFGAAVVTDNLPEPRAFEVPTGAAVPAPIFFARRGVYELGPAEVRVGDPFGLLNFARLFREKTPVVVYPRVHDLPGFPVRGGKVEAGAQGSRGRRGDEFAGLREYRRGDDRRHIHWKSVARTGQLFVKEFAVEAPHRYAVALDLRREGLRTQQDEVEDAVSAAASVLAHLKADNLPFRLLCADKEGAGSGAAPGAKDAAVRFGSDDASYWAAMGRLAAARADGERAFSEVLLEERAGLGEGVVLVSRTRDEGLLDAVRRLRGSGLSVIVVALAAHTYRMPQTGSGGPAAGLGRSRDREAEFWRGVEGLEAAGAAVRVLAHPAGVPGLAGDPAGGRSPAGSAGRGGVR